jgi:hypothetical protein
VLPPLAWGLDTGLGAFVELGRKRDGPLNKRAVFRDDGAQARHLDALSPVPHP